MARELYILYTVAKTVLVVDDDPAFSNELSRLLKKAGYTTIQAKDGKEAVQAMQKHEANIGAAIVDLAFPEVGGIPGHRRNCQCPTSQPIPLLAVTGAYKDLYLEVAVYLGAQAFGSQTGGGRAPYAYHRCVRTTCAY